MNDFKTFESQEPRNGISELINQCVFFGQGSNYVQGAGGNLSFKLNNSLFVKASGTRLKDAEKRNIFLELNLNETRSAVLTTEDLSEFVISTDDSLKMKPSIETAIHCLLPHSFVTHVHSIGSISRVIESDLTHSVLELREFGKCIAIPYVRPGLPLANAIMKTLEGHELDPEEILLILLGNHGIIAAGPSGEKVRSVLMEIEQRWNPHNSNLQVITNPSGEWNQLLPETLLSIESRQILLNGALTPDQAVFLGSKPFVLENELEEFPDSLVVIKRDGSFWVKKTISADALEIALAFIQIATITSVELPHSYLSDGDIEELLNWDAEKWRKAQER